MRSHPVLIISGLGSLGCTHSFVSVEYSGVIRRACPAFCGHETRESSQRVNDFIVRGVKTFRSSTLCTLHETRLVTRLAAPPR